jgi:hypothetical protein
MCEDNSWCDLLIFSCLWNAHLSSFLGGGGGD